MNGFLSAGIAAVLLATSVPGSTQSVEATEAAQKVDIGWLGMVDSGDYTGSWKAASEIIRSAVTEDRWTATMNGVRTPLGKMLSRSVKECQYSKTMPGRPDGEYVICGYETKFEHKPESDETVTAVLEKNGVWRVAGYFIK
jgi:hypothetical protein